MRLVWIDDDVFSVRKQSELLGYLDHLVDMFSDYDSGLEHIRENNKRIDAIILDVMMPPGRLANQVGSQDGRTTGLVVYKLIRQIYRGPILIYSVFRDKELVEQSIMTDHRARFLNKPATEEEILAVIREIRRYC